MTVSVENMYASADDGTAVVSQATLGEVVEVLETSGAFARVRTPDRYEGWIPGERSQELFLGSGGRLNEPESIVLPVRLTAWK